MKKTKVLSISISILAVTLAGIVFSIKNDVKEADAYSHVTVTNLPKALDLSDSDDDVIRNYYNDLNSLDESELKGTNLLKHLKPILSNNQTYYSYDADSGKSNSIWCMYEIIDRDWKKSPASDIVRSGSSTYINGATYNGETKQLTGYNYGKTDPYIHALYIDRSYDSGMTAWGNHSPRTKEWCMEREHIWPKSHGFDTKLETTGGARGDPMHLWAAEGYSNGIHSNYYYGYVDRTQVETYCGNYQLTTYTTYPTTEYANGNVLGVSLTKGSGTVFEPQDSDKGDIARAVFYMAARYNNFAGANSGIDSNEPNLILDDNINKSAGASDANTPYNLGLLHDLLEWNKLDPVDEFEIHRNNLLFNNYTNNRNPFIDFPEWADFIWGTPEDDLAYSDPTGYAQPDSDTINGYNDHSGGGGEGGEPITITSTMATVASNNNWTTSKGNEVYCYTSFKLDSKVTISTTGTPNCGSFWGNDWRLYQAKSGNVTVSVPDEYYLDNIKFTFGVGNNGTLLDGNSDEVSSNTDIEITHDDSVTFTVGSTSGTSGQVKITAISVTYHSIDATPTPTSVVATCSRQFKVGDIITSSNITVKDDLGNTLQDFTFSGNNYQFLYSDAPSGGAIGTKSFTVSADGLESDSLEVGVYRPAHISPTETKMLDSSADDFSSITVTTWKTAKDHEITVDDITYSATLSYNYNNYLSFQTLSDGHGQYYSDSVLSNSTRFSSAIQLFNYELGGNSLPTIDPTIEFSNDGSNWSTSLTGKEYFFRFRYVGSFTGYVNIDTITVTLVGNEKAANFTNFMMFEDTENQCESKYSTAVTYFENMTSEERYNFMNGNLYTLNQARTRFRAWAVNQGENIHYEDGDYIISTAKIMALNEYRNDNQIIVILTIISLISLSTLLFAVKKRKQE